MIYVVGLKLLIFFAVVTLTAMTAIVVAVAVSRSRFAVRRGRNLDRDPTSEQHTVTSREIDTVVLTPPLFVSFFFCFSEGF